jgi:hypothetical protein
MSSAAQVDEAFRRVDQFLLAAGEVAPSVEPQTLTSPSWCSGGRDREIGQRFGQFPPPSRRTFQRFWRRAGPLIAVPAVGETHQSQNLANSRCLSDR